MILKASILNRRLDKKKIWHKNMGQADFYLRSKSKKIPISSI
ncbi:MAG: hypothetical protein OFPI_45210 [Osedax symbiont Rs2]|nr:MAG: hypothetical protein OFPI_45210 [Osedax symbiont Rs2]EPJ45129.1 MAG: hypothetical protein OFPII_29860 [Osedax symbiont Rs1]